MSAAATQPTVSNLSGTPVLFLPVPTPWPSSPGCDGYIYRLLMEITMIAYDPAYVTIADTNAASCFAPQQSMWLSQNPTASPSTALGPTFVCPEAFHAVHSTVLKGNSAEETQFTYCCPSKHSLAALQPPSERYYVQCTSTAEPGATLSYLTYIIAMVPATTITNTDGKAQVQSTEAITFVPTSTVVRSSASTIYAPPFNGYNIIKRQNGNTSTANTGANSASDTAALPEHTAPPESTEASGVTGSSTDGLSLGAIAGIVVGAGFALGLLALGAFFIRRRYPRAGTGRDRHDELKADSKGYNSYQNLSLHDHRQYIAEVLGDTGAHEMPHNGGVYAHELPVK